MSSTATTRTRGALAAVSPGYARALAGEFPTSGHHFAAFTRGYCRHTMKVPNGPPIGSPFELEPPQRAFWNEALEFDPVTGRRIYQRVGKKVSRKNGKTTELGAFALYVGGPWDGEHRPTVILAAGSMGQAGELKDQTDAFVDDPLGGSPKLRGLFVVRGISIVCPSVGGVIRRVAGDGKLNHSLNPHVVVADELHAWKTARQRENWKALTTAQGAREDPLVVFITTEGEDEDDELFDLMERIRDDPNTEVEHVNRCHRIYRNRAAGMLVYDYGAPAETELDDLETIKLANPASWRTPERLAKDLADPSIDENTKRRLYMGIRVEGAGRWISDAKIAESQAARRARKEHEIPAGELVALGVDAARTRDTTALGWAWADEATGDCLVDCHVWSCRSPNEVAADTYVAGNRLDNDAVRDYIHAVILERFGARLLFYDERYFDTQANDLAQDGMVVVAMHQGKPEMVAAWNEMHADLYSGRRLLERGRPVVDETGRHVVVPTTLFPDGAAGRTLVSHVRAAKGKRNAAGDAWIVRKEELPIDGLAAVVMARYGARHFAEFMPRRYRAGSL